MWGSTILAISWCLCSDGSAESSECGFHDPGQDRGACVLMARPSHQNVGSTILAISWCLCSDGSAESSECGFHDPGHIVVPTF